MDRSISSTFQSVSNPSFPLDHAKSLNAHGQQEALFHLARHQSARAEQLRAYFRKKNVNKLFIGTNINGFDMQSPGWEVTTVGADFFLSGNDTAAAIPRANLEGAIVLLNNNDLARLVAGAGDTQIV